MSNWKNIDPDDIPGYLIDHLEMKLSDDTGRLLEEDELGDIIQKDGIDTDNLIFDIRDALEAYHG